MVTERQERWLDAAEADASRNPLAAQLFLLIAQPNDQERAAERRAEEETEEG